MWQVKTRSDCADLQNCVVHDLPIPYVQELTILTKMLLLVDCVSIGTMSQYQLADGTYSSPSWLWSILSAAFTLVYCFTFQVGVGSQD